MPSRIFSEEDLARLDEFPAEILTTDLIAHFTLTGPDRALVEQRRRAPNRLGVALQVCALRYLGFVPEDLAQVPAAAISFLAEQLEVDPADLAQYGRREQTRSDHFGQVCRHLGYAVPGPLDVEAIAGWLVDRALEHDRPSVLFHLARERFRAQHLVRPRLDRIVRLVGSARQEAQARTYEQLAPLLTPDCRTALDRVLDAKSPRGPSVLAWLNRGAARTSPEGIKGELAKVRHLRELGVDKWDLSVLHPNRRKLLAQIGRRSTNQAIARMPEQRRYPVLVATLHEALVELLDEVADLYCRALHGAWSRSRRELESWKQDVSRATNEKVVLFSQVGKLVLDPDVPDGDVRARIFASVRSREALEAAVAESDRLIRPLDDSHLDLLEKRYSHICAYAPAVLDALECRSGGTSHPVLEAVAQIQALRASRRRRVPDDAPLDFVPSRWLPYVVDADGRIDRHQYELCAYYQVRDAFRSGDVWIQGSRRHADPASHLIPPHEWPALRPEVCRMLSLPVRGEQRLQELGSEIDDLVGRVDDALEQSESVRIEDDRVVVTPLQGESLDDEVLELNARVSERLPRVELADPLIEVSAWTGFLEHFTHAGGSTSRTAELPRNLFAAILAQACNFGLTAMSEITEIPYRQLAWTTDWYVREDTLKAATAAIVNYQYRLPLARAWGGGTLSSSDGQRFPVRGTAEQAVPLPRYFGLGKGLTYYTWTSDQYSQYGSKVISATVRDATYVLDEILDNQTDLPILEHTTDTTGFTELVFALFDLLGLHFSPRIRDLGAQRLYRIERAQGETPAAALLRGVLRGNLVLDHWDDLLRVTGSLKLGWVTASLLISKLQAAPRQNVLTRAMQEYGRLPKTRFILRWIESEELRRRVGRQLNKGESMHALRRFLAFANEGKVRRRRAEDQTNQVLCLNLVTNAIVTWNTVYMHAAVEQLRAEGAIAPGADLSHLSPTLHEHVNRYGKYSFDLDAAGRRKGLRPLRDPGGRGASAGRT